MKRQEAQEYVRNHLKDYLIYQGINPDKQFHCLSPSHNDKKPSMGYVDNTRPAVHCLSCGATYDTFDVIGIFNNVDSFKEKEKLAYEFFNISIDEPRRRVLSTEEQKVDRLRKAMSEAVEVTRDALKSDEEFAKRSREYLASRKISQETIDRFKIGVEFGNKIPTRLINQLYFKKSELLEANLMRTTNFGDRDTFYNRIVIPICDEYGNPLGFGGRSIEEHPKIKYLNTSETPIFHKGNILFNYHQAKNAAKGKEIVLVEGYFDVISAWEMGMKNVVASMGVGLQDNQIKLIQDLECEVIVCLDNPLIDEAGKKAMLRIIPELISKGLTVSAYDTALLGDKVKDFGDFNEQNIPIEKIKETKILALHFLLKYEYFNNRNIDVNSIATVYRQLQNRKLIKSSHDEIQYTDYLIKNSSYSKQEIENIIHPKGVEKVDSIGSQIAQNYFYNDIKNRISDYATSKNDKVLLKMIEDNKITKSFFFRGINQLKEKDIPDGEVDKFVDKYVKEYIVSSREYKEEKKIQLDDERKSRLKQMPDILDNVYGFDKNGKEVQIYLTDEQKEIVVQQFQASFKEQTKQDILNPDISSCYSKLFIADNEQEFKRLWLGINMVDAHRWYYEYFTVGKMAAVPYATCFRTTPNVDMKTLSNEYVTKIGDKYCYKTLFVFNNKDGILKLTPENYINPNEKIKEQSNTQHKYVSQNKELNKSQYEHRDVDNLQIKDAREQPVIGKEKVISIPLKEGEYLTTSYGIYVVNPTSPRTAIYIDNKSYSMDENSLNISLDNKKPMSIYNLKEEGNLSIHSRKFFERLEKDQFINNFQSMYTIVESKNNDISNDVNNEEPEEMVS